MDAVEFLKTEKRICDKHNCRECPLSATNNGTGQGCEIFSKESPEECVAIVEKWSAEHPVKTRQSEFLKMFPNAKLDANSVSTICPRSVDTSIPEGEICDSMTCSNCRKEYWFAEVK